MGLSTLTNRERQWRDRARRAVEEGETWEACPECLRFHPEGYEGPCDDLENRLPSEPERLVG